MCPTHHRADDRDILVVTENYVVKIRRKQLGYADAEPTRRFIVDFDGRQISLPEEERYWPDRVLILRKSELAPV